jgi:hypothetical protein
LYNGAAPDLPIGQALLGEDDFVEKLTDHLKKHRDIPEIPRSQRYSTRPALAVLLPDSIMDDRRRLMKKLSVAVEKYGYHQSELARHLALQATVLLNSLLDLVRDDAGHPLYSLVSVIGDLIEAYEIDHEPVCNR